MNAEIPIETSLAAWRQIAADRLAAAEMWKSEAASKAIEISDLRAMLGRARHHIQAALSLNEDNRLALAVQGRAMVREIDAEIGPCT